MSESCRSSDGHLWEFDKDSAGEWRWTRTATNGEIVGASTEGYVNKQDCIANAKLPGMDCDPSNGSCKSSDGHLWEFYKDNADEWRWTRTATNGEIVGASTEGYVNKQDCIANAKLPGMDCDPSEDSED